MAAAKATDRARNEQLSHTDARNISLNLIDPPAENPRENFDQSEIDSLAESIAEVGLLQPVIVRPQGKRFELVAGERRYRAVTQLGWLELPATVRELDDRTAAEIRLIENIDRKSLNAVEEAKALEILTALGHDVESLTQLVRWSESDVAGRLQVLELPHDWQQLLREDGISLAAVEYVLPFREQADVLDAMLKHARNRWPLPLVEWRRLLNEAVIALSRSLEPDDPTGPRFELSDDRLSRLEVIDLELSPRQTVKRAFAVDLWDEWQDEADSKTESTDSPATPPADPQPSRTGASRDNRFRSGRNGKSATAGDDTASRSTDEQFAEQLRVYKASWLRRLICEHVDRLPLDRLQEVIDGLSIDAAAAWQLEREFLELYDEQRLRQLAGELGVDVGACRDAAECVAVLLHAQPTQVPSAVIEA